MLLKKFLKDIVFSKKEITTCIIGPEPNNARAIKAYEKAGFKYIKTVQIPNESESTYVMEIVKSS
jgi:RimJ/RimL family protein N-acetyltransferase